MEGLGFVLLILIAVFYFLPAVIANQRDTNHLGAIFTINLLFGWTILGWLAALIWAVVEQPKVKAIENPWAAPVATTPSAPHQDKPLSEPLNK